MGKVVRMIGRIARKLEFALGRMMKDLAEAHPIVRCRLLSARLLNGDVAVSPSPGDIVRAIRRRATDVVAVWDYGKDAEPMCPNRFDVKVPDAAWHSFYGMGTDILCNRIERMVRDDLNRRLTCSVKPKVTIAPDMGLLEGELTVDATFMSEDNDDAAERQTDTKDHKGSTKDACSRSSEKAAGDATLSEKTPAMVHPATSISLKFETKQFPVRDGSVIGIRRRDKSATVDIELPYSKDFYWVSQEHGKFIFDSSRRVWLFKQLGSNGSVLIHGDETKSLEPGEETEIVGGDLLALAGSRKTVAVIDDYTERTVARPAA